MKRRLLPVLITLFIFCFSFNVFAMSDLINGEFVRNTPMNEETSSAYKWTWLSDERCVRYSKSEVTTRSTLDKLFSMGALPAWATGGSDGIGTAKTRDTYTGNWSQSVDGIWSCEFDDMTIPVGITKIDDVLYAFNGIGQLKEGVKYWNDYASGADGLVTCQDAEFLEWLSTQYVPACTSYE